MIFTTPIKKKKKSLKLAYHQLKKSYSYIHLLYCLRDIDYIIVTLIYKFFVVKFVLVLAFFYSLNGD